MRVGSLAMQKFVYENSKSPDICLWTIDIIDETFGRHVDGRSDVDVLELGPRRLGKTEICYFGLSVMNEYVRYFDIPMDDTVLRHIEKPFEDGLDVGFGLGLAHKLGLLQLRLQVPLVANFSNYVAVAIAGEDLVAVEYVGML
jgi:hypothetical protein